MSGPFDEILTEPGREAARRLVAEPGTALVAVDFDGTLAPIVPTPDAARPLPEAPGALTALGERGVQVAVVTGRPAGDAARRLQLTDASPVVVLGHYGLQRWSAGSLSSPPPHPGIAGAREELSRLVGAAADGVRLEDKEQSLAVHTRGAAAPNAELTRLRPQVEAVAHAAGLEVVSGRFVLEVRPGGADKGGALRGLLTETGARTLVFAGDDLGDLPAVAVIEELRGSGGAGLLVCSDSEESPAALREAADVVADGPAGTLAFLAGLADAIGTSSR